MKIFKNGVGRPSNETLRKRRIIKITGLVVCVTLIFTLLLRLNILTKLKGDVTPNPAFTDQNFYCAVVQAYNNQFSASYDCNNYSLTDEELAQIPNLSYSYQTLSNTNGLEKLVGLRQLYLSGNNLNEIDLNNLTSLAYLDLGDNNISEIDVSNLTNLTYLRLSNNNISKIDVSNLTNLTELYLSNNNISEIDVSNLTNLTELDLDNNNIGEIDVSSLTNLTRLYLYYNNISEIDVSGLTNLTYLDLSNNNLSEIIFNNNNNMESLSLSNNNLKELDVSNLTNLTELNLFNINLVELNVSNLANLEELELPNNNISEIDVSKNTNLRSLNLTNNNISEIDISNNTNLSGLFLENNNISEIDISNNTNLDELSLDLDLYSKIDYSNLTASEVVFFNNFVMLPDDELDLTEIINFFDNKFNISEINLNNEVTSYNNGKVTAIKEGFNDNDIVMGNGYRYEPYIIVMDKIKSDVYDIDYKNKYIYVGEDTDEQIKENITMGNNHFVNMCNSEEDFDSCMEEIEKYVFYNYKINKNILKSIYSDEEEYHEINYQLGRIDLSGFNVENKVINIDSEEFDINTMSVDNVRLEYKNGKLLVYSLNDKLLDEYTIKLNIEDEIKDIEEPDDNYLPDPNPSSTKTTTKKTTLNKFNPKTYDNIMNYFIIGGISIILLATGIIIYIKKKK